MRIWAEKPEGCSLFKFNNLGLALGMALKFYTIVSKEFKLKVRKFWRLILTFVEVTWEKLVGGSPPSILNMVKVKRAQEARVNFNPNFSFKMFKIMRFWKSPKCSKSIVELTFPIQKASPCTSLEWLFCSVVPFLGKLVKKLKIFGLSWNTFFG